MNLVHPGIQLQNRYLVLQPLGKGGWSQTFDVDDRGTVKVLKVLDLQRFHNLEGRQKAIALFEREAEVLRRLNYPGIPRVEPEGYFILSQEGQESIHCLVMEKINGLNLDQWLKQERSITPDCAIVWLKQLVQILAPLHEEGLIHRDIKPSNIMLQPDGQLTLIDFGGVREVSETYLRNVTGTGLISPGYTPPEQAEGRAVLQSDFFALGRTFVHLLTGDHPLDLERDPRSGKLLWADRVAAMPPLLADLIDYLMALLPGRRPQTPQIILRYLEEILAPASPPVLVRPGSPPPAPLVSRSPSQPLFRRLAAVFRPVVPVNPWEKVALRHTLSGHEDAISAIALSPDNQLLISGSYDTTIKLWSLRSKTLVQTLTHHRDRVTCLAISPDSYLVASSSHDKTVKLWSLDGNLQQTLTGHLHKINAVMFSPNGKLVISSSSAETKVWSTQTGRLLRSLSDAHAETVRTVAFHPNGKTCVIGYLKGTIEVWSPHTGQFLRTLSTNVGGVTTLAFSPDGQFLAGGIGRTLQLWHGSTGQYLRTLETLDSSFAVAFNPNSQVLASGGDRDVTLWQPHTGELRHRLSGHAGTIRAIAFSPDNTILASGSQDKTIKLWLPTP